MFRLDAHLIWLLFGDFQPSMWFCFGMRQNGKSLKKLAVIGNQIHGPGLSVKSHQSVCLEVCSEHTLVKCYYGLSLEAYIS